MKVVHIVIGILLLTLGVAFAEEPAAPVVDGQFSPEQEQRIDDLKSLSVPGVFEALHSPEFSVAQDYMDKAIYQALGSRSAEAVADAMVYVRSPQAQVSAEGSRNLYLAKRVCQVFPDQAVDALLDIYSSTSARIRANVIYVVGQMAGGPAVKNLLVEALYDTTVCQPVTDETLGDPLRICDAAYNQLVIRYKIPDVLRVIGSVHSIDVRDYHIQQLLDRL